MRNSPFGDTAVTIARVLGSTVFTTSLKNGVGNTSREEVVGFMCMIISVRLAKETGLK